MGSFSIWHWLIVAMVGIALYGAYCFAALRKPWLYVLAVLIWPIGSIYGLYRLIARKRLPPVLQPFDQ